MTTEAPLGAWVRRVQAGDLTVTSEGDGATARVVLSDRHGSALLVVRLQAWEAAVAAERTLS